jgi:hypothetical protein
LTDTIHPTTARAAHYSVSDGRDALGVVKLTADGFVAVTIDGSTVGVFPTLQQAARAFHDGGER